MFRSHRYILIRIGSRAPLVSLIIASPLTAVLDLSPAFDQLNLEIDIGIGSAFLCLSFWHYRVTQWMMLVFFFSRIDDLVTWGFSHVTRSTVNLISTVFCGLSEFAPEIRFASALFVPFGASWLRIDVHLYCKALFYLVRFPWYLSFHRYCVHFIPSLLFLFGFYHFGSFRLRGFCKGEIDQALRPFAVT